MEINVWAVIAAALSSFLLGGVWYSKALFGAVWNREAGRPEKGAGGEGHPAKVFGVSIALALFSAWLFAKLLGPEPELRRAVHVGLYVGVGFVAASFGINYAFATRGWKMWVIDGGYHAAQFVIYGLILGLWH